MNPEAQDTWRNSRKNRPRSFGRPRVTRRDNRRKWFGITTSDARRWSLKTLTGRSDGTTFARVVQRTAAMGNGGDWMDGWGTTNNSESSWSARYKSTSCINSRRHSLSVTRSPMTGRWGHVTTCVENRRVLLESRYYREEKKEEEEEKKNKKRKPKRVGWLTGKYTGTSLGTRKAGRRGKKSKPGGSRCAVL